MARDGEAHEIGHGPAGDDGAARPFGEAQQSVEPAEYDLLEHCGGGAALERERCLIETGAEHVADGSGGCWAGGYPCEKARVSDAGGERRHMVGDLLQGGVHADALHGQVTGNGGDDGVVRGGMHHRGVGDVRDAVGDHSGDAGEVAVQVVEVERLEGWHGRGLRLRHVSHQKNASTLSAAA